MNEHHTRVNPIPESKSPLASSPPEAELGKVRHRWDPNITSNVDAIISSVVQKYESGEFSVVITPSMLCSMGSFEARFCGQAFRRKNRSAWVEERFPNGFASFVAEINLALDEKGIHVVSAKRELPLYHKLPQPAVLTIKAMAELMRNGDITRETAIASLERDHGISLSSSQRGYYFNNAAHGDRGELEHRKAALTKQIQAFKKEMTIDLSIASCQQGVLYESFVGLMLAETYGHDLIATQIEYPILHRDLSGRIKNRVFIDFQVEFADHIQVVEAKLGNNFENILDSALSQLVAVERGTGQPSKIVIVYLTRCPMMQFAIDSNILVDEYLDVMELTDYIRPNRRITECIEYRPISELLPPGESIFQEALTYLQENLQSLSREEMRRLTRVFDRIRQSGETECLLSVLLNELKSRGVPTPDVIDECFPRPSAPSLAEQESIDRRLNIRLTRQQGYVDGMLLALSNFATGGSAKQLTSELLTPLEALSSADFQNLLLHFFSHKESEQVRRPKGHTGHSSQSIVGACNRVIAIERADNLAIAGVISRETVEYILNLGAQDRARRKELTQIQANMGHRGVVNAFKSFLSERSQLTGLMDPHTLGSTLLADFNDACDERAERVEEFAAEFLHAVSNSSVPQIIDVLDRVASEAQANKLSRLERSIIDAHPSTRILHDACQAQLTGQKPLPKKLRKELLGLDSTFILREPRGICEFAAFIRKRFDDIYHLNPGALEILTIPFMTASKSTQAEIIPSPYTRTQVLMKASLCELDNILLGIQLAQSVGGTWIQAASQKEQIDVPISRIVAALDRFKGFAEIQLFQASAAALKKSDRLANVLTEESAVNFSRADCADLQSPAEVLVRMRDRIAFNYYLVSHYIGMQMVERYGESFSTVDGKHKRLGAWFEHERTQHPQAIVDVLKSDTHALRTLMCCDFLEHRLNQARILQYFDNDFAVEFLFRTNPAVGNSEPLTDVYHRLSEAMATSDQFFTELMS